MGGYEGSALVLPEPTLGYHSLDSGALTNKLLASVRTVSDGQFDWGGRLLKSNGGVQRFPQNGWKPFVEYKGRRELNCDTNKWSRYESRA